MNADVQRSFERDELIDITTTGRKSGRSHRIEIGFHIVEGKVYISGRPGKRDWYANLLANPDFTFHLKGAVKTDLPARAIPITDEGTRRRVLPIIMARWGNLTDLEHYVTSSPLVEIRFPQV
jgi:deazaflavin-dependent oxidoreductase (nitroreductase family)